MYKSGKFELVSHVRKVRTKKLQKSSSQNCIYKNRKSGNFVFTIQKFAFASKN